MKGTPGDDIPEDGNCRREDCAMTQQEIADFLGVSKSAVSQVENRALRKLRAHPEMIELLREIRGR